MVEHRLIGAEVRHDWSRLRKDCIDSVWLLPDSQKHSQVGQAGVRVVGLEGTLVSLTIFATSQFRALFDKVISESEFQQLSSTPFTFQSVLVSDRVQQRFVKQIFKEIFKALFVPGQSSTARGGSSSVFASNDLEEEEDDDEDDDARHFAPGFRPRLWCPFLGGSAGCPYGNTCTCAHHESELHPETLGEGSLPWRCLRLSHMDMARDWALLLVYGTDCSMDYLKAKNSWGGDGASVDSSGC